MHVQCCICETKRPKFVSECPVCVMKTENVLLKKEIERLTEYLNELKGNERVDL